MTARVLPPPRGRHLDPEGLLESESPTCALTADGTIVAVNARWLAEAVTNGGAADACGVGVNYLRVCDDAVGERSGGASAAADGVRGVIDGTIARFELEYAFAAHEERRWFSLRVSPQRQGGGVVISHHDVTASRRAERELTRHALRDPLTGLPNRTLLHDRLEQALAEGSRSGRLVAVAVLRVDGFAAVNDRLGDEGGDAVLVEIASRLELRIRDGDTIARVRGLDFAVVWRDLTSIGEVTELTARLAEAFESPIALGDRKVLVAATIGVSVDTWAQTADELLLAAEATLLDALRDGTGQLIVTADGPVEAPRRRTEVHLRAAMYRDELVVHYQPVVDMTRGTVVGVEALVRWQHPTDGLLEPDLFIPIAEEGGLIVALGARVLEQACAQAARWHADGLFLDLAVNLSTRQVAHPDLVRTIERVLLDTGLDPAYLVLEVTESTVMEDAEAAAKVFSQIVALGVSLAIDDFGTGYSSLVYLKRYPIEALKIDRSFVGGMGLNDDDDAIVASVIGLARAVGGSCIAEGVETEEQYAGLRALRCGFGQGWLFGRAVPADELPTLVQDCQTLLAGLQSASLLQAEEAHEASAQRDQAADERDQVADERDQAADQRDQAGQQRDQVADQRDDAGERRDEAGDRRDDAADRRDDEDGDEAGDEDAREVAATGLLARTVAASDRARASKDRVAGESERIHAELDRENALADRGAGAHERHQVEQDRRAATAHRSAPADPSDSEP